MKYKIEKNIPIPIKSKGNENAKAVKFREILSKLKVGESVLIEASDYYHIHNAKRLMPGKFIVRSEGENHKRVWRTE